MRIAPVVTLISVVILLSGCVGSTLLKSESDTDISVNDKIVPEDKQSSATLVALYKKNKELSKLGDVPATYNLAVSYLNGLGVERNTKEAFRLFKHTAKRDYAPAARQLAHMYLRGDVSAPNKVLAHAWLSQASRDRGIEGSNARADLTALEKTMKKSEIKKAKMRIYKDAS